MLALTCGDAQCFIARGDWPGFVVAFIVACPARAAGQNTRAGGPTALASHEAQSPSLMRSLRYDLSDEPITRVPGPL